VSFSTTVRCEIDSDERVFTAVARVTLFPNPRGCIPDPPDVQWVKVILGHGEEVDANDPTLTIALDDYIEYAIELAQDELGDSDEYDFAAE
jgi:hypothetical protein